MTQKLHVLRNPKHFFFNGTGDIPANVLQYTSKLKEVQDNLLVSPDFKAWTKDLNDFNKTYLREKTIVAHNYTDGALSQLLVAAKKNPNTEKMGTKLQLAWLNAWARGIKDPAKVTK